MATSPKVDADMRDHGSIFYNCNFYNCVSPFSPIDSKGEFKKHKKNHDDQAMPKFEDNQDLLFAAGHERDADDSDDGINGVIHGDAEPPDAEPVPENPHGSQTVQILMDVTIKLMSGTGITAEEATRVAAAAGATCELDVLRRLTVLRSVPTTPIDFHSTYQQPFGGAPGDPATAHGVPGNHAAAVLGVFNSDSGNGDQLGHHAAALAALVTGAGPAFPSPSFAVNAPDGHSGMFGGLVADLDVSG